MKKFSLRRLLIALVAAGSVGAVGLSSVPSAAAAASDGFKCDGQVFQSAGGKETTRLYAGRAGADGAGPMSLSPLGPATSKYNAIGIDPDTHYIFAVRAKNDHLLRINKAGRVADLGKISGLPNGNYYRGAFDPEGNYYIIGGNKLYWIDVDTRRVTKTVTLSSAFTSGDMTYMSVSGFAENPTLWGADNRGGRILGLNPYTGEVSSVDMPSLPAGRYGGAHDTLAWHDDEGFAQGDGELMFLESSQGKLYRLRVYADHHSGTEFGRVSVQDSARPSANNDATGCSVSS
ncbi:hypothetical protein ABIE67_000140 [Streptomyces sp. V4I8]|uniref:DUF6923 family protein n=1 Tax=Streptomyces sp. V4I8 TaxID=3156469 RepID=UPI003517B3DA